jgi:hypothetical protein
MKCTALDLNARAVPSGNVLSLKTVSQAISHKIPFFLISGTTEVQSQLEFSLIKL